MEQQSRSNIQNNLPETQSPFSLTHQEPSSNDSDLDIYLEPEDEKPIDNILRVTKSIYKPVDFKKKYHNIPTDQRLKLIEAVEEKGEKIKHAAKKLGINYSSAKSIYQVYKREGRFDKKTFKRRGVKDSPVVEVKGGNEFAAFNLNPAFAQNYGPPNPIMASTKIDEPVPYMDPTVTKVDEDSRDSLTILRDRLIASRAGFLKSEDYDDKTFMKELKAEPNSLIDQANSYIQFNQEISSPEKKNFSQTNTIPLQKVESVPEEQKPKQSFLPTGAIPNYLSQQGAQPIYYFQPQAMGAMMMPPQQSFQYFNPTFTQNITQSGPTQTININQPQARNMNIQTFSSGNGTDKQQTSQVNMGNMPGFSLNNGNMPSQNNSSQPQYIFYPVQQMPMMSNFMNGFQNMQPARYMIPQNNNVQMNQMGQMNTANAFPQVIMNAPNYFSMPNQNYNINFRGFQPVMMQKNENPRQNGGYNVNQNGDEQN